MPATGGEPGVTVTQDVDLDGGTVASSDGKLTLDLPADAVATTISATISPVALPVEGSYGPAYEVGPSGLHFAKAVRISIAYDPTTLGAVLPEDLRIAYLDAGAWIPLEPSFVDITAHVVTGFASHLCRVKPSVKGPDLCCTCLAEQCRAGGGIPSSNNCSCSGPFSFAQWQVLAPNLQLCEDSHQPRSPYCAVCCPEAAYCADAAQQLCCLPDQEACGTLCCPQGQCVDSSRSLCQTICGNGRVEHLGRRGNPAAKPRPH